MTAGYTPPGLYRDAAGAPWMQYPNGLWSTVGDHEAYTPSEVEQYGPFTPLFTVDELIPDPDNPEAVGELVEEALAEGYIAVTDLGSDLSVVIAVCRVLRARAEARGGAA